MSRYEHLTNEQPIKAAEKIPTDTISRDELLAGGRTILLHDRFPLNEPDGAIAALLLRGMIELTVDHCPLSYTPRAFRFLRWDSQHPSLTLHLSESIQPTASEDPDCAHHFTVDVATLLRVCEVELRSVECGLGLLADHRVIEPGEALFSTEKCNGYVYYDILQKVRFFPHRLIDLNDKAVSEYWKWYLPRKISTPQAGLPVFRGYDGFPGIKEDYSW